MTHSASPTPTPPPLPPTPATTPAPTPIDGFRLTEDQVRAVGDAQKRAQKIRRAISVAKFDAWTVAIFGGATFLFALLSFSWFGILLGGGMCVIAWVEFRGAKGLRQFDPDATRMLGMNQLVLGGLLIAYALYMLWGAYHGQGALSTQLNGMPELRNFSVDVRGLEQSLSLLVYGTLVLVGLFGQGGTALYYFSRRKYIDTYLRETPAWIVDAQRAGLPV